MKTKIHPKLHECEVSCRCGNKFTTRSTLKSLTLAICSECHPFYTGKSKFVDAAGQVDKFMKKFQWSEDKAEEGMQQQQVGLTKKQILAKVRKEKAAEKERERRLIQAEEAARVAREAEDQQASKQGEAKRSANQARGRKGPPAGEQAPAGA